MQLRYCIDSVMLKAQGADYQERQIAQSTFEWWPMAKATVNCMRFLKAKAHPHNFLFFLWELYTTMLLPKTSARTLPKANSLCGCCCCRANPGRTAAVHHSKLVASSCQPSRRKLTVRACSSCLQHEELQDPCDWLLRTANANVAVPHEGLACVTRMVTWSLFTCSALQALDI